MLSIHSGFNSSSYFTSTNPQIRSDADAAQNATIDRDVGTEKPIPEATKTEASSVSDRKRDGFGEHGEAKNSKQKENTEKGLDLDEREQRIVDELQKRDREVRTHEQAHMAAAGQHAQGGINYEMTRGPDGKSYAVGGHVNIDTSPESTPRATIRKADQIRRAALAPADPSGQDRSVAAEATQMKLQAQIELAQEIKSSSVTGESMEKQKGETGNAKTSNESASPSRNDLKRIAAYQAINDTNAAHNTVDRFA